MSSLRLGDQMLVKLQPYRQSSVALCKHQKIGLRYFRLSPIIAKIVIIAHRLELPRVAKIHPVFHVSHTIPAIRVDHL